MQDKFFFIILLFLLLSFTSKAEAEKASLFDLSLAELADINISIATGIKQSLMTAPATASVISAQQIKEMGATTLDEVLETIPGLHVSRSSTVLDPIYSIRGIQNNNGSHVQILLNGISITTPFLSGRGNGFRIALRAVKKIEVVRGPGSAVYGADAFAGTVNIITKESNDINGTKLGGRISSFDSEEAWLQHGDTYFDWDVAFSFEYQHTDGDSGRKVKRDLQTAFDTTFGTSASLAPGSLNTRFELYDAHLGLQKNRWDINLWASFIRNFGPGPGIGQTLDPKGVGEMDRYLLDIAYENADLVEDWLFNVRMSYLYQNLDSLLTVFPSGTTLPIGSDGNLDFFSPNGIVNFTDGLIADVGRQQQIPTLTMSGIYSGWQSHRVRIAAEFKYEDFTARERKNFGPSVIDGTVSMIDGSLTNVTDTPFVYNPDTSRTIWAGLIQDEWNFATHWHLTAGVRYDHYSDFGSTVNPRVALVWEALDSMTTKLLYGRAFRAPSFQELGNINNPVTLGNPSLDPETINTFEWVLDYHPTTNIRSAINLFYYEIEDLILAVPDPGATTVTIQNARDQIGYGFEWEMQWQVTDNLKFNSNYAWQHSEDKETHRAIPNIPIQQFYFSASWEFLPHWNLHNQLNWVGEKKRLKDDPRSDVDDYLVIDLVLKREKLFGQLDLSAGVKNVFDEQASEPSSSSFPDDYPIPGRSLFIETQIHF